MNSTYQVRIQAFFEAAHNLRSYKGKPEPLHGHSWKVEVEIESDRLDPEGMAFDFIDLKQALEKLTARLNYTYINEVAPFTDLEPTAENIARWMHDELRPLVEKSGCWFSEIRVWEGRLNSAAYRTLR